MCTGEETANVKVHLKKLTYLVEKGEKIGDVGQLHFRDPDSFVAGELHKHPSYWAASLEKYISKTNKR